MKFLRMFRKAGSAGPAVDPQSPKVFVVLDTKGAGRVVGVFEREGQALEILAISPQYYRVYPLRVNEINAECVRWVQDEQGREKLQRLSSQMTAIKDDETRG